MWIRTQRGDSWPGCHHPGAGQARWVPTLGGVSAPAPSQVSAPGPAGGSSRPKDAGSCWPRIAQMGGCSLDTFLCLSGATAAGGNACCLRHVARRAPRPAKIWGIASLCARLLRRKPSVGNYRIHREEMLGFDTGKAVGDPRTSTLEGLCCEGARLPPAHAAEAGLRAEQSGPGSWQHSYPPAVAGRKPSSCRPETGCSKKLGGLCRKCREGYCA